MMQKCTAIVWASAALAFVAISGGAEAKIACSNGYQNVQGSWLATPYCQDDLVAKVARQYGMTASAAAIRNNLELQAAGLPVGRPGHPDQRLVRSGQSSRTCAVLSDREGLSCGAEARKRR